MDDVRAIVFDVFGTLVDWRGSVIAELTALGAARGLSADWNALTDAWRGAYAPSMDRVRRGDQPWTRLDDLHRAALDKLLPEFALDALDEADRRHLNAVWHRLTPWPDTVAGLARLRGKFLLGPLSNGNVSLLVDLARHTGIVWDMVFGSDVWERYKPDPETYLGVCRLLDLAPRQVMLVAAHNYDLHAARALGLRTGFVARPTEHGPGQTADLAAEAEWDVIADDMVAIAERMGV